MCPFSFAPILDKLLHIFVFGGVINFFFSLFSLITEYKERWNRGLNLTNRKFKRKQDQVPKKKNEQKGCDLIIVSCYTSLSKLVL